VKQIEYKSEIAHLRQQMELECAAMHLALKGVAAVARHAIISHRHSALDSYQEQLEQFVGYQQALQISLEIYDQVIVDNKDLQV
jgi:thymidylate synthase ThyX